MPESYTRIETQLVHAGEPLPRIAGAVEMPIFQSATYEYAGEGSYDDVRYLRINNTPSQLALHAKLAVLEGAEAALVTASGMAAISTTLLTVLYPGDHLLAQRCLYGGTHDLLTREFPRLGIERRLHRRGPRRQLGRAPQAEHARHLCRGDDQPAARGGRPAARWCVRARPRADLDHRQHLRQPGQLPPDSRTASTCRSTAPPST